MIFCSSDVVSEAKPLSMLPPTQLTVSNGAGYEDTVLWNPYGNEGMGYNNFVCVESVKVSLHEVMGLHFSIFYYKDHKNTCSDN